MTQGSTCAPPTALQAARRDDGGRPPTRPVQHLAIVQPMNDPRAHILVVDDDRGILTMLELALAHEQYSVATATSGEEALAAVRWQRPDAILIDVRLDGEDGLDVARRMRAVCDAPAVLMTAGERPPRGSAGAGADAWLMKPFDLADLYAAIGTVLRRPSAV